MTSQAERKARRPQPSLVLDVTRSPPRSLLVSNASALQMRPSAAFTTVRTSSSSVPSVPPHPWLWFSVGAQSPRQHEESIPCSARVHSRACWQRSSIQPHDPQQGCGLYFRPATTRARDRATARSTSRGKPPPPPAQVVHSRC